MHKLVGSVIDTHAPEMPSKPVKFLNPIYMILNNPSSQVKLLNPIYMVLNNPGEYTLVLDKSCRISWRIIKHVIVSDFA